MIPQEAMRKRTRVRAYRAGREMTANGRLVRPGDLVLGGHRVPNLAECLQLGYMIPVEEGELSEEELDAVAAEEQAYLQEAQDRMLRENPDLAVRTVRSDGTGEHPPNDQQPDRVLQVNRARIEEMRAADSAAVEREQSVRATSGRRARTSERATAPAPAVPEQAEAGGEELDADEEETLGRALQRQSGARPASGASGSSGHAGTSSRPGRK